MRRWLSDRKYDPNLGSLGRGDKTKVLRLYFGFCSRIRPGRAGSAGLSMARLAQESVLRVVVAVSVLAFSLSLSLSLLLTLNFFFSLRVLRHDHRRSLFPLCPGKNVRNSPPTTINAPRVFTFRGERSAEKQTVRRGRRAATGEEQRREGATGPGETKMSAMDR